MQWNCQFRSHRKNVERGAVLARAANGANDVTNGGQDDDHEPPNRSHDAYPFRIRTPFATWGRRLAV